VAAILESLHDDGHHHSKKPRMSAFGGEGARRGAASFLFCNGSGYRGSDGHVFNGDGVNMNVDDFTAIVNVDSFTARTADPLRRKLTGGGNRGDAVERKLDQLIAAVATLATAQARLEDSDEHLRASMKRLLLVRR
jgi:hypothetical protein